MARVLWGLWVRARLASAKLQRWLFTVGKWGAIAFIAIYILGFMAGMVFEGLGYPELGRPLIELIGTVNGIVQGVVSDVL